MLNENYWDETVEIFSNLKNNRQTVDELLNRYYKITNEYHRNRTEEFNDIMVNGEIPVFDFIEGLKSDNIDIDVYEEDGVIFPEEETSEEIVDNDLDGSEEPNSDEETPQEIVDIGSELMKKNLRKNEIQKENTKKLLPLSKDYSNKESKLYKSNLNRLQYILLQTET